MPRRKVQGVELQRKPLAVKTPGCIQLKKTALDAKLNDVEGPIKPPRAMEVAVGVEGLDTSYLHKKFKKVAGMSCPPKTEPNPPLRPDDSLRPDDEPPAPVGRYVCPYCQLACAKPSVLQKHVRAHTNERPYPCAPCGFAFKTKSNLYKHCRSQSHCIKTGLGQPCGSSDISDDSAPSSPASPASAEADDGKPEDTQPRIYKPKFHKAAFYHEGPEVAGHGDDSRDNASIASPASERLQQRISKIIRDNQVIFETMEPQFSKKFLQRQNSREKESSSPKSDLDLRRIHETKSKLALALLKVDRIERSFSPSYPKVNSDNQTYQPLNLTKKPSVIKEILMASRDAECKPERMVQLLTTLQCTPHLAQPQAEPEGDVGPLLGSTPLIDVPSAKKRRVQSTTVPPDPHGLQGLARRLSTSSLPSTLKSLEELSRHPMKQPSVHMFGGQVKILDCGEPRTVRIGGSPENPEEGRVVTVAKTGLHASGGTLVSAATPTFHMASILSPDTSGLKLAPNVITPNLSVPGMPQPETGVLTIMHGETPIPFVPGMPGPQSLLAEPRRPKSNVSSLAAVRKLSSSSQQNVPNDVPKIEISSPPTEERPPARKFLRPTSLPLKPGSFTPKRLHQGTTPTVLSLVSPETPRPNKSYGQLHLNGHAYTYLGLKCSTRTYYCTISRPQPMYVVQSPQRTRLSMYSNWKVYSETDALNLSPGQAMAQYNNRYRTGGFTTANSCNTASTGLVTHSSAWRAAKVDSTTQDGANGEPDRKRQKVCNGGYESLEDYTYVRGRGRGRYVCEECGIRCKKPSMLKKHIRTHTDLRPYSCRHCCFAFKTKGNLTKHMKSKAHFKRCAEIGADPKPPALSDTDTDSDRGDDSATSDTETEDSDDDYYSNAGADALEREVACSLLSLSSTPRVSQCVAAGLLPRTALESRPLCYPYTTALLKNAQVQTELPPLREEETPIDLSQKERGDSLSFLSKDSEFLQQSEAVEAETPREERPVPAYLAESIAKQQQTCLVEAPGGHMLQAYLTAKALRDVQMKQQHRSRTPEVPEEPVSLTLQTSQGVHVVVSIPPVLAEEASRREDIPEGTGRLVIADDPVDGMKRVVGDPVDGTRRVVVGDPADGMKRVVVSIPSQPADGQPDQRVAGALSKTHDANLKAEFFPPASGPNHSYVSVTEDGRSICVICNKTFSKPSQLRLHVNIHYFERPFRCEACAVSFRTKGHLQKHERSVSHHNKVSMNTTFGTATTTNPRPFKCDDCKIAFRIHGHLAKHLRSKMHIMKLECIGKLPFGTYAELERSGFNLNEIDTTDCDNSLESLQTLAQKLYEKDSSKFGQPIIDRKTSDDCTADSDSSSSEGMHTDQLQCGVCGEPCDSPAALQVHMFADHNRDMVLDKRKPED